MKTIEQGHIRVGPSPITDPAMLVTRHMEDFVTWVDTSARKRTIMKYNDEVGLQLYLTSHFCPCLGQEVGRSELTVCCL